MKKKLLFATKNYLWCITFISATEINFWTTERKLNEQYFCSIKEKETFQSNKNHYEFLYKPNKNNISKSVNSKSAKNIFIFLLFCYPIHLESKKKKQL